MMRRSLSSVGRGVALATVAALALTMFEPLPVLARDASPASKAVSANVAATSGATDFSAARRRTRHRGGGNNAAAIAAFGAFAGIIGGAIAESQRRDYYRDRYYDGGGPGYYGPGYGGGYYGGGPRYYGGW